MVKISPLLTFSLMLVGSAPAADQPPTFIEGWVVDATGRPVVDVEVASYWSANGWKRDADGKLIGLIGPGSTKEEQAKFWANEGQMEPMGHAVRTGPDGTFRVKSGVRNHHVMALIGDRTQGALAIVPVGAEGKPLTITLGPLVRVEGQIRGPRSGEKPTWTHVYAERAGEPERPVDLYRIAACGSFEARFEMLLPAGRYRFDAYNDPDAAEVRGRVEPAPELTIAGTEGTIDLGTWHLTPQAEAPFAITRKLQVEHKLPTLKDWIGRTPPPVFAADARGVPKDWQPGRSGKWQLIEFWGRDCPACITRAIPDLMAFHEQHAAQADRFEIISIFLDVDGKIGTVAQMDEALRPIIKHVRRGKTPPFPTLVDPTTRTVESFGLAGYGETVLMNPDGKIVAGDLETLRGILDKK